MTFPNGPSSRKNRVMVRHGGELENLEKRSKFKSRGATAGATIVKHYTVKLIRPSNSHVLVLRFLEKFLLGAQQAVFSR